mgnify:CR=1 FL=1
MKKLRFKELCQDKNTGMYYKRGDVVEFEDARALEIMQHNVAEIVEERQDKEHFVEDDKVVEEEKETETVEEQKEEAEEEKETETVEESKEQKPKRGRKPKAEQDK